MTQAERIEELETFVADLGAEVDALRARVNAWCDGIERVFGAAGQPVPEGLRRERPSHLRVVEP